MALRQYYAIIIVVVVFISLNIIWFQFSRNAIQRYVSVGLFDNNTKNTCAQNFCRLFPPDYKFNYGKMTPLKQFKETMKIFQGDYIENNGLNITKRCKRWMKPVLARAEEKWKLYVGANENHKYLTKQRREKNAIDNIADFTYARRLNYSMIHHECIRPFVTLKLDESPRSINIFIAVGGRSKNLLYTLKSLDEAAKFANIIDSIHVTIIEFGDKESEEKVFSKKNNFLSSYIHVPKWAYQLWGCGIFFPTSLAHNIGFMLSEEAEWNLFLVADFVLPLNFFVVADLKNKTNEEYFSPYTYALYLTRKQANKFFKNWHKKGYVADYTGEVKDEVPNPTGGAIFIKSTAFKAVGGYDPELFCGWAPEDHNMIFKLGRYTNKVDCFEDVPRVNQSIVHVPHKRTFGKVTYTAYDEYIANAIKGLPIDHVRRYLAYKKRLLSIEPICDCAHSYQRTNPQKCKRY